MTTSMVIQPSVEPSAEKVAAEEQRNQELLAKADAGTGVNTGEKLYAGKYRSEEDLAKATLELLKKKSGGLEQTYKELEKDFHSGGKTEEQTKDNAEESDPAKTDAPAKEGSVDFKKIGSEYAETGAISDETKNQLKDMGIPEEVISQYFEGLKTLSSLNDQAAFNLTGGEDNYRKMTAWAKANLSENDVNAYNDAMVGDVTERNKAVAVMFKKYSMANPSLLEGRGGNANAGSDVYTSVAQLTKDIGDPRYKKDPSFRDTVEKKLARSKIM